MTEVDEIKLFHTEHLKSLQYDWNTESHTEKLAETIRGNLWKVLDSWGSWFYARTPENVVFLAFKNKDLKTSLVEPILEDIFKDRTITWEDSSWGTYLSNWLQNDANAPAFGSVDSTGFSPTFNMTDRKKKKRETGDNSTNADKSWVLPKVGLPFQTPKN